MCLLVIRSVPQRESFGNGSHFFEDIAETFVFLIAYTNRKHEFTMGIPRLMPDETRPTKSDISQRESVLTVLMVC